MVDLLVRRFHAVFLLLSISMRQTGGLIVTLCPQTRDTRDTRTTNLPVSLLLVVVLVVADDDFLRR